MDVAVADFALHVRVVGDPGAGAPLVAIPGGPGLSQEYLAPLARLATPTRAFVTFDPRGVGRSRRPGTTPWTLPDFAADTEAVRVAIGAEKIHLVGHSYSGLLAMEYAIEHGDHLASLVLVDSITPTGAAMHEAMKRYLARQQSLAAEGIVPAEEPKYDKGDCREATLAWAPVWFANPRDPRARDFPKMTCVDVDADMNIHRWDLTAALAGVSAPALVVEPGSSPFGIEMSDAGARALSHARLKKVVLPACGHFPWIECPEPFFGAVVAFLSDAR
jgi:proline iminopeptidase